MLWLRREFYLSVDAVWGLWANKLNNSNQCFVDVCIFVSFGRNLFNYISFFFLMIILIFNATSNRWTWPKIGSPFSKGKKKILYDNDDDVDDGVRRARKYAPKIMTLNHKWLNLFDCYRLAIGSVWKRKQFNVIQWFTFISKGKTRVIPKQHTSSHTFAIRF